EGGWKYVAHGGEGEKPWAVEMKPAGTVEKGQTSFADRDLAPGTLYHYAVKAVADGKESDISVRARTQPPLIEDGIASVLSAKEVRLAWAAPKASDVVGYHVERAVVEVFSDDEILRLKKDTAPLDEPSVGALKAVGPFVRLTKEPVKAAAFTDDKLDLTKPQTVEGEPTFVNRFRSDQ